MRKAPTFKKKKNHSKVLNRWETKAKKQSQKCLMSLPGSQRSLNDLHLSNTLHRPKKRILITVMSFEKLTIILL